MKSLSIVEGAPGFSAGQVGYRYLYVFESGDLLHIVLLLPNDPVRGLANRLRTGRRHFIRSLAKMQPTEKDLQANSVRFGFNRLTMGGVPDMLDHLDARLAGIFEAPLSAKLVEYLRQNPQTIAQLRQDDACYGAPILKNNLHHAGVKI